MTSVQVVPYITIDYGVRFIKRIKVSWGVSRDHILLLYNLWKQNPNKEYMAIDKIEE